MRELPVAVHCLSKQTVPNFSDIIKETFVKLIGITFLLYRWIDFGPHYETCDGPEST